MIFLFSVCSNKQPLQDCLIIGWDQILCSLHFYRLQPSCSKVIISQASVILSTGGMSARHTHPGRHPLGRHPPPRQTSPKAETSLGRHPPPPPLQADTPRQKPPGQTPPGRQPPGRHPRAEPSPHPPTPADRLLQRTVRILLECILVYYIFRRTFNWVLQKKKCSLLFLNIVAFFRLISLQKLARILHQAAEKYGDVDPYVVEEILKVTKEGSVTTNTGPASQSASYSGAAASVTSSGNPLCQNRFVNYKHVSSYFSYLF